MKILPNAMFIEQGILCRLIVCLSFFTCMLVRATMVEAQYRAGLQGTVSDTTGSVIPNAKVTIVDKETNQTQTTKTDAGGTFTFNRLAPALYSVQRRAPDLQKDGGQRGDFG